MFKKYAKNFLEREVSPKRMASSEQDFDPQESYGNPFQSTFALGQEQDEMEEPETVIGENVSLKGEISFEKLLRIDGHFEGQLLSQGKLIVGPTGCVKCDINLEEAYISGKVEGNINVKNRLVLRGRAEVRGDITASTISVDEGVSLIGHIHIKGTVDQSLAD